MTNILKAERKGKKLEITINLPDRFNDIELHIESSINSKVSKYSEVPKVTNYNPHPGEFSYNPNDLIKREMWFPGIDIEPEKSMEAVVEFDNVEDGMCLFNGTINKYKIPLESEMVFPAKILEHWENSIYIESLTIPILKKFYLKQRVHVVPAGSMLFKHVINLLTNRWCGKITAFVVSNGRITEIASVDIKEEFKDNNKDIGSRGLSKERLYKSLKGSVEFILRCQNKDINSPLYGGQYTFYDLDYRMYRMPHWIWCWGPAVNLLLNTSKLSKMSDYTDVELLKKTAIEIGDTSLRFQVHREGHLTDGQLFVRWVPRLYDKRISVNSGYTDCISGGSDSNFLSGWAWIPLYETTGDVKYLEAAKKLALAVNRMMDNFEMIPQDYLPEAEMWTDHTLNESTFGVEGPAELYRVTGDERFKEIGRRFIDQHIDKLMRPDGLWDRSWERSKSKAIPNQYLLRADGWVMEGLLAANRLMPGGKYLEYAKRLGDYLIEWQHPEGFWTFAFKMPLEEVGVGEKGTALWSMLFYNLYNACGDAKYLEAARKALKWCLDNQYEGEDEEAKGSLVGYNALTGLTYLKWSHMSCSYASGFFGLAVLEELKLLDL